MLCVYVLLSVVVTWIRRTELMKQINEDCQNKLELSKFVSHVFTTYSSKRGVFHEKWNLITLCSFMWSFLCVEKLFTISFHNWDIITVASGRTNINVNCVMVSVKKWESLLYNIWIDIVYMKVVRLFPCNHLHFLPSISIQIRDDQNWDMSFQSLLHVCFKIYVEHKCPLLLRFLVWTVEE